ncbi:MAG: DUF423 domain-containing protein [Acidobacteriota bacterium]
MTRLFFALGAAFAGLGVALGAFGAHMLEKVLSHRMLHVYDVGQRYEMIHALALMLTAWAVSRWGGGLLRAAGWLFAAGIVLFSGSLYVLALTGVSAFGIITPFGGTAFLLGWIFLAVGAAKGARVKNAGEAA